MRVVLEMNFIFLGAVDVTVEGRGNGPRSEDHSVEDWCRLAIPWMRRERCDTLDVDVRPLLNERQRRRHAKRVPRVGYEVELRPVAVDLRHEQSDKSNL